jgi:hypothetical protein
MENSFLKNRQLLEIAALSDRSYRGVIWEPEYERSADRYVGEHYGVDILAFYGSGIDVVVVTTSLKTGVKVVDVP